MKNTGLVPLFLTALACGSRRDARQSKSDAGIHDRPVVTASKVLNACLHPDSLALSSQHARILAAMFATDRNRGRTTFGFPPPDPSQIRFLSDQDTCDKANAAFESLMTKWGAEKGGMYAQPANLYVYRADSLYVLLYPDRCRHFERVHVF
jgi:hypothetical protein